MNIQLIRRKILLKEPLTANEIKELKNSKYAYLADMVKQDGGSSAGEQPVELPEAKTLSFNDVVNCILNNKNLIQEQEEGDDSDSTPKRPDFSVKFQQLAQRKTPMTPIRKLFQNMFSKLEERFDESMYDPAKFKNIQLAAKGFVDTDQTPNVSQQQKEFIKQQIQNCKDIIDLNMLLASQMRV